MVATQEQLVSTVTLAFYEAILSRHKAPRKLLSDAPNFRSTLVATLCHAWEIRKCFATPYYPLGDGYAERFMPSLATLAARSLLEWITYLPGIAFGYNITQHSTTGMTFWIERGRIPRLPG